MLWNTEVRRAGDGRTLLVAVKAELEGDITAARKALGGLEVVSRTDVYELRRAGYIKARKLRPGKARKDGRAGNTKWIFDLVSCAEHKRRMEGASREAVPRVVTNCELF